MSSNLVTEENSSFINYDCVEASRFRKEELDLFLLKMALKIENKPFEMQMARIHVLRYDDEWKAWYQTDLFAKILINSQVKKESYSEEEIYELQNSRECCILQPIGQRYNNNSYQFYTQTEDKLEYCLENNNLTYINDFIENIITKRISNQKVDIKEMSRLCTTTILQTKYSPLKMFKYIKRRLAG